MNLKKLITILDNTSFIKRIQHLPSWNDDPRLHRFICELAINQYDGSGRPPDPSSNGTSINKNLAIIKAVCEGWERFSLAYYSLKEFTFGSYAEFINKTRIIDPKRFCFFSKQQLKESNLNSFSYDHKEKYYWTEANELTSNIQYLVPAQLIYCPYNYVNEKVIMLPISSGAALADDHETALYKALCELLERDAFITTYLLSVTPCRINLEQVSLKVATHLTSFRKFNLNVELYYLKTLVKIPTILSVITDNHPTSPAIAIGLKTDFDIDNAILGAIDEAYQVRSWQRFCLVTQNFRSENYTEKANLQRALFWSNPRNSYLLDFIRKSATEVSLKKISTSKLSSRLKLLKLKRLIKSSNINIYYKDVTHPELAKSGIKVIKCISPDLHPHFIDENYPYYGGSRLEKLKKETGNKINLIPNPFL